MLILTISWTNWHFNLVVPRSRSQLHIVGAFIALSDRLFFCQTKTYIRSRDLESSLKLFITKHFLSFTDEKTKDLVQKCLQQLHLLTLQFEILASHWRLLNGLVNLGRTVDFRGNKFTRTHL